MDKKQYNSLVNEGIIPKYLENIYQGGYGTFSAGFTSLSTKLGPYKGEVPALAASLGEILFLEDWSGYSRKNHTCALVYHEFLVICSEPEMEILNHVLKPNNILPVAIPLYRIVDIKISEDKNYKYDPLYKVDITFDNNQVYSAILFSKISYRNGYGTDKGTFLQGINWSFEANQRLLSHALSYTPGNESYNQRLIANTLVNLVNKSTDFSKLENAIQNLDCNTAVTKKLMDVIYKKKTDLIFTMLDNLSEIKANKKNSELTKKLTTIADLEKLLTKELEESKKQKNKLTKELNDKQNDLKLVNFLKKPKILSEIKKIEIEIRNLNEKINGISIPLEMIEDAFNCLMKNSKKSTHKEDVDTKQKALELYELCIKKGVESINTKDDKMLFEVIYKNLNISNNSNPMELFEYGKKLYNEKDKNKKKDNKTVMLKKLSDEEAHSLEKNNTKFIGKDKYLYEINKKIKEKDAMSQIMDLGYQAGRIASQTKATKSDEYLLGGLANGIAGGAAALATVSDIREKNARSEANAEIQREKGNNLMRDSLNMKSTLSGEIYSLERQKREIDTKLCDTSNTSNYFEYLDCKIINYEINISGYLTINVEVDFKKEPKIKDMPIVIDGSLKINVLHKNKTIGNAFLNAPGLNITSTDKIGFNYKKQYSVIALPFGNDFNENEEYTFEITPIHL